MSSTSDGNHLIGSGTGGHCPPGWTYSLVTDTCTGPAVGWQDQVLGPCGANGERLVGWNVYDANGQLVQAFADPHWEACAAPPAPGGGAGGGGGAPPSPPTGGTPPGQTTYGAQFVQVLVPWQYAECMANPAQPALRSEPGAGAAISPATQSDVGDGGPDPQYWSYLVQHGLAGRLLPGPGWAAQRQEQEILQWVYPPKGPPYTIVVRPPYWIAREVWDPTDCPVPILRPIPGQG